MPADSWALRPQGGDRVVGGPVGVDDGTRVGGSVGGPVGGVDGTRDGGSDGGPVGGTVGPSDQSRCLLDSGLLNMTYSQSRLTPLALVYSTLTCPPLSPAVYAHKSGHPLAA